MRCFTCLLVAACLCASMIRAQDQPKFSPAQQEVLDAHEGRTEASNKRDGVAWGRYVADDCIFSGDNGSVVTKAQLIAHIGKLPAEYDHSVNARDYVVHVYGDTAVLNLRYTNHEQFTDSDIVSEIRMTETYIKKDGRWLLIARHWAKIPTNFRKTVAVDTSTYKDYVGQYEWRPLDVETISVKDGRLWTQSGNGAPKEFLPLGADSFFLRNELGINKFTRDAQGNVIGYTLQDADGQEIHIKKIR
jgi:ketosteroid isomerase-like protein